MASLRSTGILRKETGTTMHRQQGRVIDEYEYTMSDEIYAYVTYRVVYTQEEC